MCLRIRMFGLKNGVIWWTHMIEEQWLGTHDLRDISYYSTLIVLFRSHACFCLVCASATSLFFGPQFGLLH